MFHFYFVGDRNKNGLFSLERAGDWAPFDGHEQEGFLESLCDSAFDSLVFHVLVEDRRIQESGANAGMVRIQCDQAPYAGLDFETEDIRDKIDLLPGVAEEKVQYVIFFDGNTEAEDGILQWAVVIDE